ncbi:MAG: hypothetical protein JO316_13915 [Abitibacteriaceae bacterium]|nr:hypothetical protein [Abditibacteriaceae bacterium]MBV9866444.1 hypothetical protein [Abditibacteriaceae bacterium]
MWRSAKVGLAIFALVLVGLLSVRFHLISQGTVAANELGANVNVLTHHNNNARTGANLQETVLNTRNVNAKQFGKLFERAVDGDIYAQPLYVSHLNIPGKGTRNVVFVATMHNSVYCFDADDPTANQPYWQVNCGPSVPARYIGGVEIKREVGITSTPVIDLKTGTLYAVARTCEPQLNLYVGARHDWTVNRLHAFDIATGSKKSGDGILIQAQVPGTGRGSINGVVHLFHSNQLQRAGLLLCNGVLYLGFGAQHNDEGTYQGWVLAYDAATLRQVGVFCSTPDGNQGGIWQSGNGLAADDKGNIYVVASNGTTTVTHGGRDIGCGILRLRLASGLTSVSTSEANGAHNRLHLADWFAPYNYEGINEHDVDLCSGTLLVPHTNLLVVGCKDQNLYVLNRQHLGYWHRGNNSNIVQCFRADESATRSLTFWNSPETGPTLYIWSEMDYLKAFKLEGGKLQTTPIAHSPMRGGDGMSGGFLSVSANENQSGTGIVWASLPAFGDPNKYTVPGVLRAFDASDVSHQLWSSKQNEARDDVGNFAKFCPPTVANGKVYLATFSKKLVVYGLLSHQGNSFNL